MSYKFPSFDGEYQRKPVQNLGGASKTNDRDVLLKEAQEQRTQRERVRVETSAAIKIQRCVKSFVTKGKEKRRLREVFDGDVGGDCSSPWRLLTQLKRLVYFYHEKKDASRLYDVTKTLILNSNQMLQFFYVKYEECMSIVKVLMLAMNNVNNTSAVNTNPFIRLIEIFTDVPNSVLDSPAHLGVVVHVWLYLIMRKRYSFFREWHTLLRTKLGLETHQDVDMLGNNEFARSALTIFKRPFVLLNHLLKLEDMNYKQFRFRLSWVSGREVYNCILSVFSAEICSHGIPAVDRKEIVPHVLLPALVPLLGERALADMVSLMVPIRIRPTHLQNMLYAALLLTDSSSPSFPFRFYLDNVVLPLIPNIEIPVPGHDWLQPGDEEEKLNDWLDLLHPMDDNILDNANLIYEKLATIFAHVPPEILFPKFDEETWKTYVRFCAPLMRRQPAGVVTNFPNLFFVMHNNVFMTAMTEYMLPLRVREETDESFVFLFLLNALMSGLHDAEFLGAVPMKWPQLRVLTSVLVNAADQMIVQDKLPPSRWTFHLNHRMKVVTTLLQTIHNRNLRLNFFPEEEFVVPNAADKLSLSTGALGFEHFSPDSRPPEWTREYNTLLTLVHVPFAIGFDDRIEIFNRMITLDKMSRENAGGFHGHPELIQVRRGFLYEDAFEKLSYENVQDIRDDIRISLVNVVGVPEAGVDGGGLLREFLTEATKAGVDPNLGLFQVDSHNRIYPNPIAKKINKDYIKHYFLMGRLVGKALYDQVLLELPFAAFFMEKCMVGKIRDPSDFLATLDSSMHKNLLMLKSYQGDWGQLGLTFELTKEAFDEIENVSLKPDGKNIAVDGSNVIEYIHLVANYKINVDIEEECKCFRAGLFSVVPVLRMFSWRELQILISGSERPINVDDWMSHTNYTGGFSAEHPTIVLFWTVVRKMDERQMRKLIKFVTSCSRPPLLGFKDLNPKFGIQSAGVTDRLPTAGTCMNLLKLPEYVDEDKLREKLEYVINAEAGFELS